MTTAGQRALSHPQSDILEHALSPVSARGLKRSQHRLFLEGWNLLPAQALKEVGTSKEKWD